MASFILLRLFSDGETPVAPLYFVAAAPFRLGATDFGADGEALAVRALSVNFSAFGFPAVSPRWTATFDHLSTG